MLTTGCNGTLIVVAEGTEADGFALSCGSGVKASTGSYSLTLLYALALTDFGCCCDREGVVKGNKFCGSTSVLDGAVGVVVLGGVIAYRKTSYVIIASTSGKRMCMLVSISATVVEAGVTFVVEVIVASSAVKVRAFLVVS